MEPKDDAIWRLVHVSFGIPRHPRNTPSPTGHICLRILTHMAYAPVPTLYKARGLPLKQQVCAICVDRTRGRTRRVSLTQRVVVHLCEAHATRSRPAAAGATSFAR